MIEYVIGLAFTTDYSEVALIRKTRGPWGIVGKLNGIGGHVDPGETPAVAMVREFEEETGWTTPNNWFPFVTIQSSSYRLHCFWSADFDPTTDDMLKLTTPEGDDEEIGVYDTTTIFQRDDMAPDLKWLIAAALEGGEYMVVTK